MLNVKFDVVAHEEVKEPIAVVINPGAAGTPAYAIFPQARLLGHIRKSAVAVVVPQDVVTPIAAEQVVPAVVVVVTHADASAPSGAGQAGLFRHVRERAVAIVLKKVLGGRLAVGIGFLTRHAIAVGQVDVEPAILVVVEEGEPAALGFNNVLLVFNAAPNVGDVEAGFLGHIHEGDGNGRLRNRRRGGLKHGHSCPSPEGRGERIENSGSKKYCGRAEQVATRKFHSILEAPECSVAFPSGYFTPKRDTLSRGHSKKPLYYASPRLPHGKQVWHGHDVWIEVMAMPQGRSLLWQIMARQARIPFEARHV